MKFSMKSQVVLVFYPDTKMLNYKIYNQVVALILLIAGREKSLLG